MKKMFLQLLMLCLCTPLFAEKVTIKSPNSLLRVDLSLDNGTLWYEVDYNGETMLDKSPLGLVTNIADFSRGLRFVSEEQTEINKSYTQDRIKQSHIHYRATAATCRYTSADGRPFSVVFQVSDNDIAFRYMIPQTNETARCIILKELSGFHLPDITTTFLTPQATPMIGWQQTKPSYEEEYVPDEAIGTPSLYGLGYTFPCLFHVGDRGWLLISETGVNSLYCGARLSEGDNDGIYSIAFPEKGENNGIGISEPAIALPGTTAWRTITVGDNLKPIVETTIPFDVVEPLYAPSQQYQFGRATWSWLEWQDGSINFDDQITFINLSAEMDYEFVLVDNWWDTRIGREKVEELVNYGKTKGVGICLWYNSNGYWSDAPQGPKNCMNSTIERKKEMAWMQRIGVKGIKVDFFGGDKQMTMQLYEEILSDANDHGLVVIFHGCTLPRGWERMYPNFVGSEAVLASENLIFTQHANDHEAYNACLHPFIRNSVASMDFGPVLLNKRHNRTNDGGTIRKTTETFQLATAVIYQTPVQNFGITPNNLSEMPAFVIDFMKEVPTTWDETLFIDGYPGKYCILARRHNSQWYIAGINAEKEAIKRTVKLPMLAGKTVSLYSDKKDRSPEKRAITINHNGEVTLEIQPDGAVILK